MQLTSQSVREALAPFGVDVDHRLAGQISRYVETLLFWNHKVNLTAITSHEEILRRHFGESMFGAQLIDRRDGLLVDVGSGAGFPGLALKLACPSLRVRLIEPVLKKAVFLSEVIRALDLSGVEVLRGRIEEFEDLSADFVTARAVGSLPELLDWSHRALLQQSGTVLLWLGREDAATASGDARWNWDDPVAIPSSASRVILSGTPVGSAS